MNAIKHIFVNSRGQYSDLFPPASPKCAQKAKLSSDFQFSLSPIRKKYPDVTIQPDSRCIVGSGGGNTVSGLAAARVGNVHSPWPAGPVIIQSVRGYRR